MTESSTNLTGEQHHEEARRLDEAERRREQVTATSTRYADLTIDDAYAIQAEWERIRLARGERLVGYKIGLTSRAMQQAMQITTPDSGFITDAMVLPVDDQPVPTAVIDASAHTDPRVEVELAFVLDEPIGFGTATAHEATAEHVLAATRHVVPALELIAARSHRVDPDTGYVRTVRDTIADNAANAGIVVGKTTAAPDDVDLRWIGAICSLNGVVEETGLAAGVLGHPAEGVAWLARRCAEHRRTVQAGHIILAGSFTRPIAIADGDRIDVDYGPLGHVAVSVT